MCAVIPTFFWSSIQVLQYLRLCEFLEKKIASFITLSVRLYSKQMLHRKVILTWPWAIITNTWCNNFSFISFYGRIFLLLLFLAHLPMWTSHCSMLRLALSLVSFTFLERMTHANACFLFFFFWICKCLMAACMWTHPGWVLVFRPALPVSAPRQLLSLCLFLRPPHPHPSLSEVWSLEQQAVCYDSSNWSKDGNFSASLWLPV